MSAGAAMLAQQIADRPAARRRLEAARAWARWWQEQPAPTTLRTRLATIDRHDPAAAAQALDAAAPLLAVPGWATRAIATLAAHARADPLFEPPLRLVRHEGEQGLVLFEHPLLRIAAIRLPVATIEARRTSSLGPRAIGFSGALSLIKVIRSGGATLDLWQAAPATQDFSLGTAPPCRAAGRIALVDGMLLRFDGASESWSFAAVEDDVVLLHVVTRIGGAPFQVEYAASDGRALAASAADGAVSRQQILADMLARMGRDDALPVLETLTAAAPFGLRWAAAQAAWRLNRAAATPLLARMADADPHPEIRAAARLAMAAA